MLDRRANARSNWLLFVGRAILASLFVLGGVNKIMNYAATQAGMTEAGLPFASILLPLTILLELGGGLMVAFGLPFHRWIALALAAFTLAANVVFHNFWAMEGPQATVELSLFFKNIAITGGLLVVAALPARKR